MSGRKKKHEAHANHERWLVSYADFITLLFAFFVVLFSASQVDRSKTNKMALAIEAAFSRFSLFKTQAGNMNLMSAKGKVASSRATVIANEDGQPIFMPPTLIESEDELVREIQGDPELNENVGLPTSVDEAMARTYRTLLETLRRNKYPDSRVAVSMDDRGLVVSMREAAVFAKGSAEIQPGARALLEGIGHVVLAVPNQVRIEGHASPVSDGSSATNWRLSADRSLNVLQWLVSEMGVRPARLSAVGYGEYRPVAENETPEGQQQNQRVDIVLLSHKAARLEPSTTAPTKKPVTMRELSEKYRERQKVIPWMRTQVPIPDATTDPQEMP